MEESQKELPTEYIEEAMKLKKQYIENLKRHIRSLNKQENKTRDFGAKKEKEINQEFNTSWKNLQEKYHIN